MRVIHAANPRARRVRMILLLCLTLLVALLLFAGSRLYFKAAYPLRYQDLVQEAAAEYDVPPSLVYAVIWVESGFDPNAVSHADAHGLMQVTDDTLTWSRYRLQLDADGLDLFDPAVNIQTGTHVLSLLGEQYDSEETVLAAYNAGIGTVGHWLDDPAISPDGKTLQNIPYGETENYVKKVLETKQIYEYLYSFQEVSS